MLTNIVVRFAVALPRGGATLLRVSSRYLPKLREFSLCLPYPPGVVLSADLANNVFFPLLKYRCYPHQIAEDLIVTTFLNSGDVVLDVGANIGHVSALCASCVGPQGRVHAFEPSKVTFCYIEQLAQQLPQITPWNIAISDFCGKVAFQDEAMSDRSHMAPESDCSDVYQVDATSLDAWVSDSTIGKLDFLKIDAEGCDVEVIEGAVQLINRFRPVIEFEVIDKRGNEIFNLFNSALKDVEYDIYRTYSVYPIGLISKSTAASNNYFAIPRVKRNILPRFLFTRGYLKPCGLM